MADTQTSCARGCCATQREHYQSLVIGKGTVEKQALKKVTTDVHDTHTVDVTERWEGQDVTIKPKTIRRKLAIVEE